MTAVLQSLRVCGNILSTDSFSYFALRCVDCEANFGQWPAFIRHLQRWHGKNAEEEVNRNEATTIVTANELDWKSERLAEVEIIEEALINPIEYLQEDEEENIKNEENDFVQSDGETTATDDADNDWKPSSVKVKRESNVEEGGEAEFVTEIEWAIDDDDDDSDDDATGKKPAQTRKVKTRSAASAGTTRSSRKLKTFYFNLENPEYTKMSLDFLELLESRTCLWNTTVKSRYGTRSKRTSARNEMKLQLRERGYSVSDKTITSTISRILQEHKNVVQQAEQDADQLDARSKLILKHCKFLNSSDGGDGEDPIEIVEFVKRKQRNIGTNINASSDDEDNAEAEEGVKVKTKRLNKKVQCSQELVSDDGENEMKSVEYGDGFGQPDNSDDESVISEYSDESNGSSKSTTGPEIVISKLKKNNLPYKRIRFQLIGNKIASDFIDLLREQPAVWDSTHPDYRNKETRRRSIEAWIPHFKQQHNITFNYDDLNENWQILRVYYMNQVGRKRISQASIVLRERLSFLSTRKTKQRVKCEHCDRFVMGERNYQNHLYLKHSIGECAFKCADCGGKEFRSAAELNMHTKQTHSGETDYRCSFCDRKFTQRNNMLMHEQQHTGVMNFVCSHCGQSFRRKANLVAHEVRIHLRQRNFPCSMCPKAFYTKGLLKDHINAHLNIRNHKCPTCGKGFHSAHALMRHKQIHTEVKRYACKLCDARFHQFVGLNAHMKSRHQFVNQHLLDDDVDMETVYLTQETVAATQLAGF